MDEKKTMYDEAKKQYRSWYQENRDERDAKKKREGYKYWCHTPGCYLAHRIYFRSLKSAKAWVAKHKPSEQKYLDGHIDETIHEL